MTTVSAPGKIHLLGEHSVVYGRPALLATIDKRLYVKIKPQNSSRSSRDKSQNQKEKVIIDTPENDRLVKESIKVFKKAFSIDELPPLEIIITSQIPSGSGLGSSASVSSAVIGALMKSAKNIWNPARINELSFEVEKVAHGNPSGADNTTVVFGGLVWFRREFEFLKSIWSLPISSYKIPQFILINTGTPLESTREMVAGVAKLYAAKKKLTEEIFHDQEKQTKKLLLALKKDDLKGLIQAIKNGEKNLEKIGVVGNFARKIIKEIENIGGAAKVCGAGGRKEGSGIVLCYHDDLSKIPIIARKYRAETSLVTLGGEGIRIEIDK